MANDAGGRAYHPQYPPQLSRAQQWKQSYRSFQTTTCASRNSADDSWPLGHDQRRSHQSEELRVPRYLPEQPRGHYGDCGDQRKLSSPRVQQANLLSPDRLGSGTNRHVFRASSFDGRIRAIDTACQYSQTPNTSYNLQQTQRYHQNPESPCQSSIELDQFDIRQKRAPLTLAPSIEISHVHEQSDSSSSFEDETVAHPIRSSSLRENLTPDKFLPRGKSAEFCSEGAVSYSQFLHCGSVTSTPASRHSLNPLAKGSIVSMNTSDRSTGLRPKLIRQPRSFQSESPSFSPKHRDLDEEPPIDEFDYFCRLANSPSGSKNKTSTPKHVATSLKPSRHPAAARSHSMRSSSPENTVYQSSNQYLDSKGSSGATSPSRQAGGTKRTHLKPPNIRGQLRRASTEEDRYRAQLTERRPINATLSYSSVHSGTVPTLCKTPPKSVPRIPACPVSVTNPAIPLGVPISEDSMFADEPGMTYYQVQVLGASGVGKTLLCQKLARLTSANSPESEFDEDESTQVSHSVTAALQGSVYTLNFMDSPGQDNFEQNLEIKIQDCTDAFIVVYAIDDDASFDAASLIINALSPSIDPSQSPSLAHKTGSPKAVVPIPVLLVGNKTDLVRGRQVSSEDGRHLANMHDAKFIEVSASLNHMVADLFIQLVALLGEAERKGRDPRLPMERRTKYSPTIGASGKPGSLTPKNSNTIPTLVSSGAMANAFRITPSTKHSLSKFLKKHFVRNSEDSD